jgi:hypothetical protein
VSTDKWFDIRELTYKDEFDLMMNRQGWQVTNKKLLYNDPDVIKQRWINPPHVDKRYSPQAFFDRFGDNTFRKLLRTIFFRSRTLEELERSCSRKILEDHLTFMQEQEIAVYENDCWSKASQYKDIEDIGTTLEWYVAEWFRSTLKAPARHGVTIEGVADGGDLDVVAFVGEKPVMVECKSGNPAYITEVQLKLFLRRVADFNPAMALLLIDTESKIDKQIEMLKKVYLARDIVKLRSSRQWDITSVHVRNVDKSIAESLRATLRSHSSNNYDGRPLVGLSTSHTQVKEKTADDHLAAMQRRLEIAQNRKSLGQTMAAWTERVGPNDYRFIQEVFSENSPAERAHLRNCERLVEQGKLRAEDDDGVTLGPFFWDQTKRYCATF